MPFSFLMRRDVCQKINLSVTLMNQHFREKHESQLEKTCNFCGVGFDKAKNFYKHSLEKHELPRPDDSERSSSMSISSAFYGALKVFKIEGIGGTNLRQYMKDVNHRLTSWSAEM